MEHDDFLSKKAFEIGYALFRVAAALPHRDFKERLERQALELMENVLSKHHEKAYSAIHILEYFVHLGAEMGFISLANSDILFKELEALNSTIAGLPEKNLIQSVDLRELFSKEEYHEKIAKMSNMSSSPASFSILPKQADYFAESSKSNAVNANSLKIEIRHSAIIDKIRQTGNCRLRDLQDAFPSVSERTLRYDLQRLNEQGLVERLGNGGPSTFYQIKGLESVTV